MFNAQNIMTVTMTAATKVAGDVVCAAPTGTKTTTKTTTKTKAV